MTTTRRKLRPLLTESRSDTISLKTNEDSKSILANINTIVIPNVQSSPGIVNSRTPRMFRLFFI